MEKASAINRRSLITVLLLLLVPASALISLSNRWARGVPAQQALIYSGTLLHPSGEPLKDEHNVEIKLWTSATSGTEASCTTGSQTVALDTGRFSRELPDSCTKVVHDNADVWVDVLVDGSSLGRSKLGAVPYALETDHAVTADDAQRAATATNANHAAASDESKHAAKADNAAHADAADKAPHADAADNANHANAADNASHASVADNATHANVADDATILADGAHGYKMSWDGATLAFIVDVTPVKTFIIDHPTDPQRYLVHTTLEGPENAVFYRGSAQLQRGSADIELPAYFEAATRAEGRTVLLTSRFRNDDEPISLLAASAIEHGRFRVRAVDHNNPAQRFDWEVKAVRADVSPLWVEPRRDQINVYGDGPYKYFTPR